MPRIAIMGLTTLPTAPIVLNVSQPYRPLTFILAEVRFPRRQEAVA
jgi:hypothetical protein